MTPPQQAIHRQPPPDTISQKVQLTYKLFLLENARNTLEHELLNLTNKAYEEVQSFFNSSSPTSVFSDLTKALDSKCQAVEKLSALLKDLMVEPHIYIENGIEKKQLEPLGNKGNQVTDVFKFGPMLQNSLMASSISKAVQVLGATLPLQQLKHFLISQPVAIQQDDMICSNASSYHGTVVTANSSSHSKAEEQEHTVVFEEERPPDAGILPPVIIQSPEISAERPPVLLPPIQAIFPEISNPKPMKITPLIRWGCEDDVHMQHQKQTSSQLLHFLRAKAKNIGALEVTVMEWNISTYTSSSPQSNSPIKTQSCQFRQVATDDVIGTHAPKTLSADMENQAPVFRVKRVDSSGSLTYACVIATKTELWDIGDIFTEVGQGASETNDLENEDKSRNVAAQVENSCVNMQWETPNLQCTEPKHDGDSARSKSQRINGITIPEFQIKKFEETEVVVSHIVSPGNFYIQQVGSIMKLRALVTDSWKDTTSYAEQNCIPDIGTKVMGWFPKQEQWCRSQVTKICGISGDNNATDGGTGSETSIRVEVKRLDYGDTACLSLLKIKELTPEMAALPLQAVKVSLANVTPVNGSDWSKEAVGWFQAMVHNRTLYARLYPQGPKITVELFFEKGKLGAMRRGASLSLRLTENGHAKHSKLRNYGVKKISAVQVKMRQQDSEWGKYLISCYTQSKK